MILKAGENVNHCQMLNLFLTMVMKSEWGPGKKAMIKGHERL